MTLFVVQNFQNTYVQFLSQSTNFLVEYLLSFKLKALFYSHFCGIKARFSTNPVSLLIEIIIT